MSHHKIIHLDLNKSSDTDTRSHIDLLLKMLRKNPELIKETIKYKGNNKEVPSQLTSDTQKLEKYDHDKCQIFYSFETKDPNNDHTIQYQFFLSDPLKKHSKLFPEQNGDAYLVMHDHLGKGGFGSVKSSTVNYWYDKDENFQVDLSHPVVRKTIKDTSSNGTTFEVKAAEAYYGHGNAGLYHRIKYNGKNIEEISMPKLPMTLDQFIDGNLEKLSFSQRLLILLNIAKEIMIFHEKTNMVHHDIKPGNIAIFEDLNVKLLDFGAANLIDTSLTEIGGTPGYMDLELLCETKRSEKLNDFYALGLIIYRMFYPEVLKDSLFKLMYLLTQSVSFSIHNRQLEQGSPGVKDKYNSLLISILDNVTGERQSRVQGEDLIKQIENLYKLSIKSKVNENKTTHGYTLFKSEPQKENQVLVPASPRIKN